MTATIPIKPLKRLSLWTLCVLPLLLGGCQSLSYDSTHAVPTTQAPAKQTLEQAMTAQFKKNFSYKTFAKILPSTRLELDAQSACDIAHDERYVALAKSAEKDGLDLSADQYLDDKDDLKQAYLACIIDHSHAWRSIDDVKDSATYTAQKRYLTDPMSLTITGNYRPLLGQMSALPRAEYRLGAVEMMVNQPMVVDWQAGKVYLWADNFALANATWLDKELGDQWHNKWLMLDFNDGSLPKDFVKEFAKAYLAMRQRHFGEGEFVPIAPKALPKMPSNISLPKTSLLIQGTFANKNDHLQEFLVAMSERYPVLLEADIEPSDDDKENAKPTINSLYLAKRLFSLIQDHANKTTNDPVTMVYGLDGKRLVWFANIMPKSIGKQANAVDVITITVFDDGLVDVFDRLPKAHQKPTANNSIDGLAYVNELLQQPNNPYVVVFERLLGIQSDESATDSNDNDESSTD